MGETVIGIHADQQPVKTETDAHILVGRWAWTSMKVQDSEIHAVPALLPCCL